MKNIILITVFLLSCLSAYGESKIFDNIFTVNLAQTKTLDLGESKYIKNIIIQAEGIRNDVMVDVMVGGVGKGTIYAPDRDPSYLVTIEQRTRYLEFRHLQGGSLKVLSVVVNYSQSDNFPRKVKHKKFKSHVQKIASDTINIIDDLRLYTTLDEESKYLMPIKLSAGRLKIMSMAHGDLSLQTRKELVSLKSYIKRADSFLVELMEKPILFDLVVELLTLKETIIEILN